MIFSFEKSKTNPIFFNIFRDKVNHLNGALAAAVNSHQAAQSRSLFLHIINAPLQIMQKPPLTEKCSAVVD